MLADDTNRVTFTTTVKQCGRNRLAQSGTLCDLLQKSIATVSEHIKDIFKVGELNENAVVRNFRTIANDGKM
jgi:hypothetical protein